jgi:hypothetical protein
MKIFLYSLVLLLATREATAQTTLQVVTKNIRKSVSWKPGISLEINCEKADITVETAPEDQRSVTVVAELSARHPKIDSARYDLEAWKFAVSTIGKKIYIRAYVGLPSGAALPASNLKAKLKISVPADCPTTLSNKFGSARIEKITAPIALSGEFCSFNLVELGGKVQVDSRYGNVEGRQLSGPVKVESTRTEVSLSEFSGDCNIRSKYGDVHLEAASQAGNITVEASEANVTVAMPHPLRHNFDLKANYGQVSIPLSLRLEAGASSSGQQASLRLGSSLPNILVETTLGNITVR